MTLAGLGGEAAVGVRRRPLAQVDLGPAALAQVALLEAREQLVDELLVRLAEERVVEAEPRREQPEGLRVGLGLAERLDRRLVPGQVVVAPGEDHVEVLELRRRRQHHVGVGGGIGHELLEHDREQVLAAKAREHLFLVWGDGGRVRAPADERLDRGSSDSSVSAAPTCDMLIVRTGPGRNLAPCGR